jgi:hypothetical protein
MHSSTMYCTFLCSEAVADCYSHEVSEIMCLQWLQQCTSIFVADIQNSYVHSKHKMKIMLLNKGVDRNDTHVQCKNVPG